MSGVDVPPQASGTSGGLREYIGFVWTDNWREQTGMLVAARSVTEAAEIVRSFDPRWHVSLWNEEEASRAR